MKKYLFPFVIVTLTGLTMQACAPVYKCGDPRPKTIKGGNRLVDVITERDQLCDEVKEKDEQIEVLSERNEVLAVENDSLRQVNTDLYGQIDGLKADINQLQKKYDMLNADHLQLKEQYSKLLSDNFQRGHMYDERLKEQERRMALMEEEARKRIAEKEAALAEREKRIEELERIISEQDSIARRLNQILREALLGFQSDELSVEIRNGKVYVSMSDKLMFKSGSANVEQKGKEALGVLARVLSQNEEFEILVEGHTDNVPIRTSRFPDNWELSVARATAMVRILVDEHELDPNRLTASGKGEFSPRASNNTPEGRAKNRRTEIVLSPQLDELMNMLKD
ncbi:MAG: OmpA family protein [Crocinitomicaceae bacterium]|nr:OmpA family protein [Crocinitomicaceae bacterium]